MNFIGPILAFAVTTALIYLLRPVAIAIGLVDVPTARKSHKGKIPLVGGLAIFVGSLLALTVQYAVTGSALESSIPLGVFFLAGFILLFTGAWDDYRPLPPIIRILAQITASLVMIFMGGVVLTDLGNLNPNGSLFMLGFMSVPFTVFACLGVINAMNMCDGLDGLSGSLALISLLGFGIANTLWGYPGNQ
ncbi:MAG: glycosyltransferase family 4 protein, partial [Gammaproteobacteria bacterium]